AVLFECLAGRRMWGDGTDIEVIRKLALQDPPRLEDACAEAPPALCALYRRLVAKKREDRPASARDVVEELRAFVAETGTRPDTRVLRAMMGRLFVDEAERRRKALVDALHAVAPSQVRQLRDSLTSSPGEAPPSTADAGTGGAGVSNADA